MKNAAVIICGLLTVVQGRTINTHTLSDPRVVNGEDVKLGERPYQIGLRNSGRQFCGGSIVNKFWVVTAAHCVNGLDAPFLEVAAGSIHRLQPHTLHPVTRIIIHEEYTPSDSYRNDIALVQVAIPFEFSFRIQPAILPKPHVIVKTNSSAVVSGWGRNGDGENPNILQKTTVYITDPKVCQAAVQEKYQNVYPTQICANDPSIRRGECHGDSGGPVTVDGVLTGIVSWSIKDPGCGSPHFPGVHTRVSEYIDWINMYTDDLYQNRL